MFGGNPLTNGGNRMCPLASGRLTACVNNVGSNEVRGQIIWHAESDIVREVLFNDWCLYRLDDS